MPLVLQVANEQHPAEEQQHRVLEECAQSNAGAAALVEGVTPEPFVHIQQQHEAKEQGQGQAHVKQQLRGPHGTPLPGDGCRQPNAQQAEQRETTADRCGHIQQGLAAFGLLRILVVGAILLLAAGAHQEGELSQVVRIAHNDRIVGQAICIRSNAIRFPCIVVPVTAIVIYLISVPICILVVFVA